MRPKVFYLSTSLNIGGTEKYLFALAESFSERYDISIGYIKEMGDIGRSLEQKGFKVVRLDGFFSLLNYLKKNKFDMLHTFLFRANILGRLAGMIAGVPVIISTQQAIDDWKSFHHSWMDGFSALWCDSIIANSQTAKKMLIARENIAPGKIEVVYNGLDLETFKPLRSKRSMLDELRLKEGVRVVAYVGRLHKEKGADLLPEIAGTVKDAVFLIIGDGPIKEELINKAKELGLTARVLFLGWRHDIADILSISDIFILPSREESFPQVILEAMYSSLSIVAFDVGGVKELVENNVNGFLIKPLDLKEFCDKINLLLGDKEKAGLLAANGRKKAMGYSKAIMLERTWSIYNDLYKKKILKQ